ncbi:MAG: helix-turn-helix domain containing protein, partial [Candidatus Hydrogenedentes bacterium]|nr:helix-turn-helix domain containing protein [Candidatus Hydrogenedentota bacterium]
VRDLLGQLKTSKTDAEVARDLGVSKNQAKAWLQRLVEEGVLVKMSKPVRYCGVSCTQTEFLDSPDRSALPG